MKAPLCSIDVRIEPHEGDMPQVQESRALYVVDPAALETIEMIIQGNLIRAGCHGWRVTAKFVEEKPPKLDEEAPTPKGQWFPIGTRVRICKPLDDFLYGEGDIVTIKSSYAQQYGTTTARDQNDYRVHGEKGESAWYPGIAMELFLMGM